MLLSGCFDAAGKRSNCFLGTDVPFLRTVTGDDIGDDDDGPGGEPTKVGGPAVIQSGQSGTLPADSARDSPLASCGVRFFHSFLGRWRNRDLGPELSMHSMPADILGRHVGATASSPVCLNVLSPSEDARETPDAARRSTKESCATKASCAFRAPIRAHRAEVEAKCQSADMPVIAVHCSVAKGGNVHFQRQFQFVPAVALPPGWQSGRQARRHVGAQARRPQARRPERTQRPRHGASRRGPRRVR